YLSLGSAAEAVTAPIVIERDRAAELVLLKEAADPLRVHRVVVYQAFDPGRAGPVLQREKRGEPLPPGRLVPPDTEPPGDAEDEPEYPAEQHREERQEQEVPPRPALLAGALLGQPRHPLHPLLPDDPRAIEHGHGQEHWIEHREQHEPAP